ncbi:MAG: calcium/sodium antiporter [Proteobacteria bacterium]|nr:calcium/sodium antiporter [Pseudomonadota bacterium]
MSILLPPLALLVGFALLMWSAHKLVFNASQIATKLGISPFVIGVIIIGFGTSAPEMFVSAMAAIEGNGNLAVGNAIGSNITNIALVIGVSSLLMPLVVRARVLKHSLPRMLLATGLAWLLSADGWLSFLDGVILMSCLAGYLALVARLRDPDLEGEMPVPDEHHTVFTEFVWCVLSIAILIGSSRLLVWGAVEIAHFLGVSDLMIGLTVIALGTSLPELAACIAGVRNNSPDMVLGNIVGSNVFNALAVLGITALVSRTQVNSEALSRDFPMVFILSIVLIIFAYTGRRVCRIEGAILLFIYVAYMGHLIVGHMIR